MPQHAAAQQICLGDCWCLTASLYAGASSPFCTPLPVMVWDRLYIRFPSGEHPRPCFTDAQLLSIDGKPLFPLWQSELPVGPQQTPKNVFQTVLCVL